jgi:uncharacterized protein YdhG (YjbR/CyaY superfamily)
MQSKAKRVDAYLAELPPARGQALAQLRTHVRAAAPNAVESMAYGMPTYMLGESMLYALAAQKQYLALYVTDVKLVERIRTDLGATSIGKSCIRFKRLEQLSLPADVESLSEAYRNANSA